MSEENSMNEFKNKNLLVISSGFPDKTNTFYGGIFVKEQLKYLKNYFNKIFVISPVPRSFGFTTEDKLCQNYEFGNVKVYFPRFWHAPISFFRKRLGDNQFRVVDRLMKRENIKFDLIHAHFTWPSGYVGAKLKEKYKKPLVVTVHGDPFRGFFKKNLYKVYNKEGISFALNKSDIIVTPHPELYNYLLQLGFKDKSFLIEKGVDLEKFGNKKKYKKEIVQFKEKYDLNSKKIITFVGNLVEDKDPLTFVRSIPHVLEKRKDTSFLLVGSGPLKKKILKEVKKYSIQSYILVLGARRDIHIIDMCSDIFCALSPFENIWSTTIQEAFAAGIPCIITKAGTTEIHLKHKEIAYLIEPKNPKELAKAILTLLENKKLRQTISKNEKKLAKNKWNIQKTTEELIKIIKKMLKCRA